MDSTDAEPALITDVQFTDASPRAVSQAARRLAIVDAAKTVFFDAGYQLASMDRIAEVAQTTKRTLYAYFPSKTALFAAVVAKGCASVLRQLPTPDQMPADPRRGLRIFAQFSNELMTSPNCIKLERIIVAEADRHPEFAATLAAAFDAGEARLATYLEACIRTGRLKPHDPRLGARLLSSGIGLSANLKSLLTAEPRADGGALAAQAGEAVITLYLDAYATSENPLAGAAVSS
jgi:AcrR family transcriptional regulator